jgi:hypothetical protein
MVGNTLAAERATMQVKKLASQAATDHAEAIYGPTGGGRATTAQLKGLRERVLKLAERNGYPGKPNDKQRRAFDSECAVILHTTMDISPAEASHVGIWAFFACVLMPDIVRWRFPGDESSGSVQDRFIGGVRGFRNTFGRLWWRAHLFKDEREKDPYKILRSMGEDELVQVMERPNVAGNSRMNVILCRELLRAAALKDAPPRTEIFRDGMKRMRRFNSFISLQALDEQALEALIRRVMSDSVTALKQTLKAASA